MKIFAKTYLLIAGFFSAFMFADPPLPPGGNNGGLPGTPGAPATPIDMYVVMLAAVAVAIIFFTVYQFSKKQKAV